MQIRICPSRSWMSTSQRWRMELGGHEVCTGRRIASLISWEVRWLRMCSVWPWGSLLDDDGRLGFLLASLVNFFRRRCFFCPGTIHEFGAQHWVASGSCERKWWEQRGVVRLAEAISPLRGGAASFLLAGREVDTPGCCTDCSGVIRCLSGKQWEGLERSLTTRRHSQ